MKASLRAKGKLTSKVAVRWYWWQFETSHLEIWHPLLAWPNAEPKIAEDIKVSLKKNIESLSAPQLSAVHSSGVELSRPISLACPFVSPFFKGRYDRGQRFSWFFFKAFLMRYLLELATRDSGCQPKVALTK